MAWYHDENDSTLNFMVVGNTRSGCGLLQSCLAAHPAVVCHGDVLDNDPVVRREEHESYFGPSGKVPDWYVPTDISLEHYLNNKIFDNALHGEHAVGVKVYYQQFVKNDLWDYVNHKCRKGDFCLLHVLRNPVACYVSNKQAAGKTGLSGVHSSYVYVDPKELTQFVREHQALNLKIDRLCDDRVVVHYHELLLDFRNVLQQVLGFMSLEFSPACIPNTRRLAAVTIKDRIGNWSQLCAELPADVLSELNSPFLF